MVAIPVGLAGDSLAAIRRELTVTPRQPGVRFGPVRRDGEGNTLPAPPPEPIALYRDDLANGSVLVPFWWGRGYASERGWETRREMNAGHGWTPPRFPDPSHPSAPPGQGDFFSDLHAALESDGSVLAQAPTGTGKTVAGLWAIGKLGRSALVIVPSKQLADQWVARAVEHLGLDRARIGVIQGAAAPWHGKDLVVAVIHNLFQKTFPPEFYRAFGTVCWDEVHRLGAPEFCKTMPLFPAAYRFGMTATPDRKDGCMEVVTSHLGPVSVRMEARALECECRVLDVVNPFARKIAHLPLPVLLKILVKNGDRNQTLADAMVRMWRRGRNVLGLGDRIEHLQALQTLLVKAGVPREQIGLFVGSYGPKGKRKPTGAGYLKDVRENPCYKVILATYAMMKEGVDIPRLDAGIDLTPRADGEQAIGRIRRPFPGKPRPVWFTPVDRGIPMLEAFARARLRDLRKCNVTVIE